MLLKVGSNGSLVKKVQLILGLNPDGDFGPITEKKLKEFQANNGMTSTGIIDDSNWKTFLNKSFKLDKLVGVIPNTVIEELYYTIERFNIHNRLRLAHFLAQCSHESGNFTKVYENLNYTEKRLKEVFPKYFKGIDARPYSNNPTKLGSRVYANRMGNGDESSMEGYKFRGRGNLHLTGKSNYIAFSKYVNEDLVANPDLVATKYPLTSAAFFFEINNLWSICDKGQGESTIKEVSVKVNGGVNGLKDRIDKFNKIYAIIK